MAFLPPRIDDEIAIPASITEDVFHYAVHEGIAFSVATVATEGDRFICFKTPNTTTLYHVLWTFSAENNASFMVWEGVTPAAGGSDLIVYNKNRAALMNGRGASSCVAGNTLTAGSVQVGQDWTGGTKIYEEFSSKNGGTDDAGHEIVLEKNTWYGFELADVGTRDLGLTLTWFEVPLA